MTEIRIMTVRQPWAWAIIHAGKDMENRPRNIAGDYRGPVAIHAGLGFDEDATLGGPAMRVACENYLANSLGDDYLPWFIHGAIIGVVDLVGVHNSTSSGTQHPACWGPGEQIMDRGIGYCSEWAESGAIHLELANARPLRAPVPFKGALGLRRFDSALLGEDLAS